MYDEIILLEPKFLNAEWRTPNKNVSKVQTKWLQGGNSREKKKKGFLSRHLAIFKWSKGHSSGYHYRLGKQI